MNASLAEAAPLIAAGGLGVVFLGDEPHVGSEANLARIAEAARSSLNQIDGGQGVLIYMNHCSGGLKKYGINQIPRAMSKVPEDGTKRDIELTLPVLFRPCSNFYCGILKWMFEYGYCTNVF